MTNKQKISIQDIVDNEIFDLINKLSPTNEIIEWNITVISQIRLILQDFYVNELKLCTEEEFYPSIK